MRIVNKIKGKLINITQMKYLKSPRITDEWMNDVNFKQYRKFIIKSSKVTYNVLTKIHINSLPEFKWVGGQYYKGAIYGIVNSATQYLKYDIPEDNIGFNGNFKNSSFKWTGGCIYGGKIYGFPRTSNELMCINPDDGSSSIIDIGLKYKKEHHYGGVCTSTGFVFQPPRNTDHILVIDLNTLETHKIQLTFNFLNAHLRYCGSIMHPNGLIYMFPEKDGYVLVLDPKSEKVVYIGKKVSTMTFDSVVGADGNIYGFSAYENGILKVNVMKNEVSMICQEIGVPGCYATKCGVNGRIYGIPGDGEYIWEFDVLSQKAKPIFKLDEKGEAKCAGGIVDKDGSIYCIPALGEYMYKLTYDSKYKTEIQDDLITSLYFSDNY